MRKLDHLVVIAPNLKVGAQHVHDQLGLAMDSGGEHPEMGTHNLLLRLGDDVFLEVIAIDPEAKPPAAPRWFGLDDQARVEAEWEAGRRLRAWVAQTDELDTIVADHRTLLGSTTSVSRGDRVWDFLLRPDGELPAAGAAPPFIDWGHRGNPAASMPDRGALLTSFELFTPRPESDAARLQELSISGAPEVIGGDRISYSAHIQTSNGLRILT